MATKDESVLSFDVLIIGAGIAGLTAAQILRAGVGGVPWKVGVLDKGRGVGGRCATRRAAAGGGFDHGAQYFTARDPAFVKVVATWSTTGPVTEWRCRWAQIVEGVYQPYTPDHPRWVATPTMSALPKFLSRGQDVQTGQTANKVDRTDSGWRVTTAEGLTIEAPRLVCTVPPVQALALLGDHLTVQQKSALSAVVFAPCWAVMVDYGRPLELGWDAARITGSPLSWACADDSKPGRSGGAGGGGSVSPPGTHWVLHASPEWSRAHLEETPEQVLGQLLEVWADLVGPKARKWAAGGANAAHRWRYALAEVPLGKPVMAAANHLVLAGDWCLDGKLEAAYLSGAAAAHHLRSAT
jgi:renalase